MGEAKIDPRAVLTALADEVRKAHDALKANGHGGDREDRRLELLNAYEKTRDALLAHICTPPVWRKTEKGYEYRVVGENVHSRYFERSSGRYTNAEWVSDLTPAVVCQLAADYYAQQGVKVPEEAVKAFGDVFPYADRGFAGAALAAALPHLLAANQPQQRKPKAVEWVVWSARERSVIYRPSTYEDALSWMRAFGNKDTRILALVSPDDVEGA